MKGLSLWPYLLIGGLTAIFAWDALSALFNPHVVGYVSRAGHNVRFNGNGGRFLYSAMEIGVVSIGVFGMIQMAQWERKKEGDRRWASFAVGACEVLSSGEALEVLLALRAGRALPIAYRLVPKRYMGD